MKKIYVLLFALSASLCAIPAFGMEEQNITAESLKGLSQKDLKDMKPEGMWKKHLVNAEKERREKFCEVVTKKNGTFARNEKKDVPRVSELQSQSYQTLVELEKVATDHIAENGANVLFYLKEINSLLPIKKEDEDFNDLQTLFPESGINQIDSWTKDECSAVLKKAKETGLIAENNNEYDVQMHDQEATQIIGKIIARQKKVLEEEKSKIPFSNIFGSTSEKKPSNENNLDESDSDIFKQTILMPVFKFVLPVSLAASVALGTAVQLFRWTWQSEAGWHSQMLKKIKTAAKEGNDMVPAFKKLMKYNRLVPEEKLGQVGELIDEQKASEVVAILEAQIQPEVEKTVKKELNLGAWERIKNRLKFGLNCDKIALKGRSS